jgi:hypothetical protein
LTDEEEDEEKAYRALVSLRIVPADAAERTISFRYDLSPWTPSMLDNE